MRSIKSVCIGVFGLQALLALGGCSTESAFGPPVAKFPASEGGVVPLPRLINELKCDYDAWAKDTDPGHDRLVLGGVRGVLTLSLTEDNTSSQGVSLGIPIATTGLVISPSANRNTETKVTSAVTIPFALHARPTGKTETSPGDLDCTDMSKRLPQAIMPIKTLGQGLLSAGSGSPYFYPDGDVNFSGQFYLKRSAGGGLSIQFLTSKINPATLGASAEYIQSYDINLNVTGDSKEKPNGLH